MIVLVDPGHGGNNLGAQRGGLIEKEWTLGVGLRLTRWINLLDWAGVQAMITRTHDVSLSLKQRAQIAHDKGADLAISLHFNASQNPDHKGFMAFYAHKYDQEAREAADAMCRAAPAKLKRGGATYAGTRWERVRNVLTPYEIPAVLVEAGFASSIQDAAQLSRPEVQDSICLAIMQGLSRYREIITPELSELVK